MKRKSILSSLFRRGGFHNFSSKELLENPKLTELFECKFEADSLGTWSVFDFLPPINFKTKTVRTHLWYIEAHPDAAGGSPDESKFHLSIKSSGNRRYGSSPQQERINRGAVEVVFAKFSEGANEPFKAIDLDGMSDYIQDGRVGELVCNIVVAVDGGHFNFMKGLTGLERELLHCSRKEWYAMELTTGYRRVAQAMSSLFTAGTLPNPLSEAHPTPDLHTSLEGAWRLICSFESIKEVMMHKDVNIWRFLRCNPSVDNYLQFVKDRPDEFDKYLNYWRRQKRVADHVVMKKTMEFFIHQTIGECL